MLLMLGKRVLGYLSHGRCRDRSNSDGGRQTQKTVAVDRALRSKVGENAVGNVVGIAGALTLLEAGFADWAGDGGGQGPGEDWGETHVDI
jgi:hypothetical protein